MTKPVRIQLSRKKGWRMPENTVKVDRTTKWGNPFVASRDDGAVSACRSFRIELYTHSCFAPIPKAGRPVLISIKMIREELRGKNLACWCPLDHACHADVLLELANA